MLGQWHSSLDPQFIWISPWLFWKAIFFETLFIEFFSAKFDTVSSTFFCITPKSKILSLSDFTQTVTLLPSPSILLNMSLTRLKSNLCWNTIKRVFEREIWRRIEYFFPIPPRSKILSLSDGNRTVTLPLDPQLIWISPLQGWKAIYFETLYSEFLSGKFDNVSSNFFLNHLGQKFFPSQTVLGQWHSSLDPQFIWISPWLDWKAIYFETLYSEFLSGKFDNVSSNFFLNHLGQKFFPSQTVLEPLHSPRPSVDLNKSFTRLKSNLCWNTT